MAPIHLEIEQVEAVLDLMINDEKEIRDLIKNLTHAVTGIHGDEWAGKAEDEFFKDYLELDAQLKKQLDSMVLFAERLRQEISEWEAMNAHLARGPG